MKTVNKKGNQYLAFDKNCFNNFEIQQARGQIRESYRSSNTLWFDKLLSNTMQKQALFSRVTSRSD